MDPPKNHDETEDSPAAALTPDSGSDLAGREARGCDWGGGWFGGSAFWGRHRARTFPATGRDSSSGQVSREEWSTDRDGAAYMCDRRLPQR